MKLNHADQAPILSNHTAVEIVVTQLTQYIQRKLIKYRKLRNIDINQLNNDLEVLDIVTGSIDDMVDELESKLLQTLNKHAPEITKTITVRHKLPWYTDKIKEQKREYVEGNEYGKNINWNPTG